MFQHHKSLKVWTTIIFIGATACGRKSASDGTPGQNDAIPGYRTEPAAGLVGNGAWSYVGGQASLGSSGELQISLIDEAKAKPCEFSSRFASDGKYISFSLPQGVGTTEYSQTSNKFISFGHQESPSSAVKIGLGLGKVELTSIDDQRVKGRIVAKSDAENMVNGTFDIPYCGVVKPLRVHSVMDSGLVQSVFAPEGEWSWLVGKPADHGEAHANCEKFTGEPDSPGQWALPTREFVKQSNFPIFKAITFWTSECEDGMCWAANIANGKWTDFMKIPATQKLPVICMKKQNY